MFKVVQQILEGSSRTWIRSPGSIAMAVAKQAVTMKSTGLVKVGGVFAILDRVAPSLRHRAVSTTLTVTLPVLPIAARPSVRHKFGA